MRASSLLLPLLTVGLPAAAAAAPSATVLECIEHSEKGQAARDRGQLVEARRELAGCALTRCPGAIRTACAEWDAALGPRVPSLVFDVRDEAGHLLAGATIVLDEATVDPRAEATEVDPGPHTVRVAVEGRDPVERTLSVREGEQRRKVVIELPARPVLEKVAPPPPAVARPRSGPPLGSWVLGGIGLAAVATGSVFEVSGLVSRGNLDTCSPTCPQERVDGIRQRLLVGDIAIGAGIALLAAGAVVWILLPSSPSSARAAQQPFVFTF